MGWLGAVPRGGATRGAVAPTCQRCVCPAAARPASDLLAHALKLVLVQFKGPANPWMQEGMVGGEVLQLQACQGAARQPLHPAQQAIMPKTSITRLRLPETAASRAKPCAGMPAPHAPAPVQQRLADDGAHRGVIPALVGPAGGRGGGGGGGGARARQADEVMWQRQHCSSLAGARAQALQAAAAGRQTPLRHPRAPR